MVKGPTLITSTLSNFRRLQSVAVKTLFKAFSDIQIYFDVILHILTLNYGYFIYFMIKYI